MLSCEHLVSLGLEVQLVDNKIRLSPVEKVTDAVKEYVRQNRDAIVEELKEPTLSLNELIEWYLSIRHTLDGTEDLFDYRNSKLSEPVELVDLILKEPSDYWMRTNGDLEHCLRIIKRHTQYKEH